MKRLLAYSTIENLGFIFLAIGLAAAFQADGFALAAVLALTAALFHVLNHALFKSLLFLGAGAVLSASGTRDLERLGGLIHRMPQTALAMLGGAAAISALPPFNGFVSEWLAFQAILLSPELRSWPLVFLAPAVGAALALSAALAAACFLRFYGIAFLGRARSTAAATAEEVPTSARAVLLGLAVLCLALGIFPGFLLDGLAPVTTLLLGSRLAVQSGDPWFTLVPIETARSSYSGFLILLFIAFSAGVAAVLARRFAAAGLRRAAPWDCGQPLDSARSQYAADSLSQPLRRVFAGLAFKLEEEVVVPPPGSLAAARFRLSAAERLWHGLYLPLAGAVVALSDRLNVLQFLTIRRYLTLVFAALVALLLLVALWR